MAKEITVFNGGGQRSHEVAGELAERIKELVYQYADRMPVATAVGVLEILKLKCFKTSRRLNGDTLTRNPLSRRVRVCGDLGTPWLMQQG